MRVKNVWGYSMVLAKLRLMWERITFSRLTTIYFVFSVVHCIIQLGLQINAFTVNANADHFLTSITTQVNAANAGIPAIGKNELRLCKDLGPKLDITTCDIVWSDEVQRKVQEANRKAAEATEKLDLPSSSFESDSITRQTSSLASPASTSVSVPRASTSISSTATRSTSVSTTSTSASQRSIPAQTTESKSIATASRSSTVATQASPISNSSAGKKDDDDDDKKEKDDDHEDEDHHDDVDDDDKKKEKRGLAARVNSEGNPWPWEGPRGSTVSVTLNGSGFHNQVEELSLSCAWSLTWPVSILDNTKREDFVFITYQLWVLGMSTVAILNESIPHIVVSLLTHVLATAWSGYQIQHTANFRRDFKRFITNGACAGTTTLIPNSYWSNRAIIELISVSFNAVALIISAYLTWRLFKLFGWQTFKRVGASLTINRMYKLVLIMSITLQLAMFFIGATVGLWVDNLFNGPVRTIAWYVPLYKATAIATLVLLVPWIVMGWISIRKELRFIMAIFLFFSMVYLGGWSVMFLADTFRWTFVTWMFFRIMSVLSVVLTFAAFVLGVICRYNFGKGLPRYLSAQEPLPGDDFTPVYHTTDMEKVEFPSNGPIPTFSATFGKGSEVPPPSQMFPSRGANGPRFFQRSAVPFDSTSTSPISPPESVMTRDRSDEGVTVVRSDSGKSYSSLASYYDYAGSQHTRSNSSRFVIE